MRNIIRFTAFGAALMAGSSLAQAQTIITGQPVDTVIAQQPGIVVTQPAPAVASVPLQTVETVRTVRSTTTPRRREARRSGRSVTTTRTTVRERVLPAPLVATAPATPAVQAIAQPGYAEVVQAPGTYAMLRCMTSWARLRHPPRQGCWRNPWPAAGSLSLSLPIVTFMNLTGFW